MDSIIIENDRLRVEIDPHTARWNLSGWHAKDIHIQSATPALRLRPDPGKDSFQEWEPAGEPARVDSPHGPLQQTTLISSNPDLGLRLDLTLALPLHLPGIFWKLCLRQRSSRPVIVDRLDLLSARIGEAQNLDPGAAAFFSNGYQSWAYTGANFPGDRYRRTRLGPLRAPSAANPGTPQPSRAGIFSSDFFGILGERRSRRGLLLGFLSQRRHFGSLLAGMHPEGAHLQLWANGDATRLEPGADMETDWACAFVLDLDDPDPLGDYVEAVAAECGVPSTREPSPTGWCSWYQFSSADYRGAVTEQDLRRNLAALSEMRIDLPLDVFQIDDGFESQVGDWLTFSSGFPDGVQPLAAAASAAGLVPGLWLAPYIVHRRSQLAREHPEWVLRGWSDFPSNAGFLWNHFAAGLDVSHPGVLDHTDRVVEKAVRAWGFRYLKLDFVYAGVLKGRRFDPTITRAQALHAALVRLRKTAGDDTFLLGCGCPLGPAVGLIDAMRISADTAPRWKPAFNGIELFFEREPDFPAASLAAHNSLTRAALHRRWWINDPDCLLVRPNSKLTLAEVQTAASVIALTGGSLLVSDDLPALPVERRRIVEALLPLIGRRPRIVDWIDTATPARIRMDLDGPAGSWSLLAAFNWSDRPADLTMKLEDYDLEPIGVGGFLREFWSGRIVPVSDTPGEAGHVFRSVPAHGVILAAYRRDVSPPVYLGSDLHISQGLEVSGWEWDADSGRLEACLERPGRVGGAVDLRLARPPVSASINGRSLGWRTIADGICRIQVNFSQKARLLLRM